MAALRAGPEEPGTCGMVLGIETATALGGVALVSSANELLGEITLAGRENHAERILPSVLSLLETLGATTADIAAVAVSRGPGSFTGLRAGIASAKGLAFSLGVPLYGVATLEALAANVAEADGPVCAVINARRGEVFCALFRPGPSGPERLGDDRLVTSARLEEELPAGCVVVGELPDTARGKPGRPGAIRLAPSHLCHPRAALIAQGGLAALRASRSSELDTLLPSYVRPPDAEPEAARRTLPTLAGSCGALR